MNKWFAVTPALILILLLTPTYAGLFGGDTVLIVKKDSNGFDFNKAYNFPVSCNIGFAVRGIDHNAFTCVPISTGDINGSGTNGYLTTFTGTKTIGNSLIVRSGYPAIGYSVNNGWSMGENFINFAVPISGKIFWDDSGTVTGSDPALVFATGDPAGSTPDIVLAPQDKVCFGNAVGQFNTTTGDIDWGTDYNVLGVDQCIDTKLKDIDFSDYSLAVKEFVSFTNIELDGNVMGVDCLNFNDSTSQCTASSGGSGTDTNEFTAGNINSSGVRLTDFNFGQKSIYNAKDINANSIYQSGYQVCDKSGNCETSTTYRPTRLTVSGGSTADTNIYFVQYYDDKNYSISEGSGANPLDVNIYFTKVNTLPSQIVLREYYLGSTSHNIQVQLWDYVSSTWQSYYQFVGQNGYTVLTIPIYDANDHIGTTDRNTILRLHHVENGISSHRLYIDFAWLLAGDSVGASTDLSGYAKYSFGYNDFNGNGSFKTATGDVNAKNLYQNGLKVPNFYSNFYVGTGASDQNIVLPFKPKYVQIRDTAPDTLFSQCMVTENAGQSYVFAMDRFDGFSNNYYSRFCIITDTGFTVTNEDLGGGSGMNDDSLTYIYEAWG